MDVAVEPERGRKRGRYIALGLAGVAFVAIVLMLLGLHPLHWLHRFFRVHRRVPPGTLAGAVALQTAGTALTSYAWLSILRAAYPKATIAFGPILTAYAVGVAMNGVLPASIGTLVSIFMFMALITGSTFAGVFSGCLVQKIFYVVTGAAVYVYIFLSVSGSFSIKLGFLSHHPLLALIVLGGVVAAVVSLARLFWRKLRKLWSQARQGGAILARPRRYLAHVLLPECGAYLTKLGVIAVFLAAYKIPVTLSTIMRVVGSNSLASATSATPGGVGVNQALNVATLRHVTTPARATAYSVSQQLFITGWNIVFALLLVAFVLGWSGGLELVRQSYSGARARMRRDK